MSGERQAMSEATERLYYHDSFLREFDAQVISCEKDGERWKIVLDRTAFYPTSGGQPHDTGKLGDVPVIEVADVERKVTHYASAAIPVGPVHGVIDWPRRIDHNRGRSAVVLVQLDPFRFGNCRHPCGENARPLIQRPHLHRRATVLPAPQRHSRYPPT